MCRLKKIKKVFTIIFLASFLTACSGGLDTEDDTTTPPRPVGDGSTVEPDASTTPDIFPVYSVLTDDSVTTAEAVFYQIDAATGQREAIALQALDEILVEVGSEIRALELGSTNGSPVYSADFNIIGAGVSPPPADPLTADFRLIRDNELNAELSTIEMATNFAISAPIEGATFQKDQLVDIMWGYVPSPNEEPSAFVATAVCEDGSRAETQRQAVTDQEGLLSFVPSNLFGELSFTTNCTLTLGIAKFGQNGVIDPVFSRGGEISGIVFRAVRITVTP